MTVAIISEYNPFHFGHEYQIKKIREDFGENTDIVSVMSGNYTQRGEIAIADKYKRAEWAVLGGANLVLELPFPYSMSSAEIFASAAIHIINSTKSVDAVSFGSECGDKEKLFTVALNMLKPEYEKSLKDTLSDNDRKKLGYPAQCELAYNRAFSDGLENGFLSPNNILALEYIKAIIKTKSKLKIHTLKRLGTPYSSDTLSDGMLPSALAIRKQIKSNNLSLNSSLPDSILHSFDSALEEELFPTDSEKLSSALISHLRLGTNSKKRIFDTDGGLYNRLKNAATEAGDLNTLIKTTETKKFTNARIKRGIWYSFFGVTSSDVKEMPKFTKILAFDKRGRALLKDIKERSDFPVITKPSAVKTLSKKARKQIMLSDKADSVFQLTKPKPTSGSYDIKAKPFVKE